MSPTKSKITSDVFIIIKNKPRIQISSQQLTEQIIHKLPVSRSDSATYDKIGKYIRNNLRLRKNTQVLDLNGVFSAYNAARDTIRTNVFDNYMKQSDDELRARIQKFGEITRGSELSLLPNKDAYFDSTADLLSFQRTVDQRAYSNQQQFGDKTKMFLADLQTHKSAIAAEENQEESKKATQTRSFAVEKLVEGGGREADVEESGDVEDELEFTQMPINDKKIKSNVSRGGGEDQDGGAHEV